MWMDTALDLDASKEGDGLAGWVPRKVLEAVQHVLRAGSAPLRWEDLESLILVIHKVYKKSEQHSLKKQRAGFAWRLEQIRRRARHSGPAALVMERERSAHLERLLNQRLKAPRVREARSKQALLFAMEKSIHLGHQLQSSIRREAEVEERLARCCRDSTLQKEQLQHLEIVARDSALDAAEAHTALQESLSRMQALQLRLQVVEAEVQHAFREGASRQQEAHVAALEGLVEKVNTVVSRHKVRLGLLLPSSSSLRRPLLEAVEGLRSTLHVEMRQFLLQDEASSPSSASSSKEEEQRPRDLQAAWRNIFPGTDSHLGISRVRKTAPLRGCSQPDDDLALLPHIPRRSSSSDDPVFEHTSTGSIFEW
eukprot:jgi/Botrbrau1/9897/Bobra.0012s0001.1